VYSRGKNAHPGAFLAQSPGFRSMSEAGGVIDPPVVRGAHEPPPQSFWLASFLGVRLGSTLISPTGLPRSHRSWQGGGIAYQWREKGWRGIERIFGHNAACVFCRRPVLGFCQDPPREATLPWLFALCLQAAPVSFWLHPAGRRGRMEEDCAAGGALRKISTCPGIARTPAARE